MLVTGAAIAWAVCNLIARAAGRVDALGFMVWSSPFAAVPLWIISLLQNGAQPVADSLTHAGLAAWLAVAWQAVGNTLFGYGVWNWLLARHSASTVTPTALLVPVFGMTASALALHEGLPMWKLGAAALVMGGLAVNMLATRQQVRRKPAQAIATCSLPAQCRVSGVTGLARQRSLRSARPMCGSLLAAAQCISVCATRSRRTWLPPRRAADSCTR